jgi:hypothetical protein
MPLPKVTFFCELDKDDLDQLMSEKVITGLKDMHASLSLGLPDLSPERAEVVLRLNQAGVPLTAWLLLPKADGYWMNLRNAPQAFQRYFEFKEWTRKDNLKWKRIGLDIEPKVSEFADLIQRNWRALPLYFMRMFGRLEYRRGLAAYRRLVSQIRADGFPVESYQLPLIQDERKASSFVLQRVFGILDLPVDREVWMLYTSFVRPHGAGMLASYAGESQAIALGSTGGGVDLGFGEMKPLSWEEFSRDLRLAWYYRNDIYIFSLEGCIQQGFFEKLTQFSWDYPVILPEASQQRVEGWRRSLQSLLWFLSHASLVISSVFSGFLVWKIVSRYLKRNNPA